MRIKKLVFDVKEQKLTEVEEEVDESYFPSVTHMPQGVDLEELRKLVEYAKSKGWI